MTKVEKSIKFTIDGRYIFVQTLKSFVGYIIGLLLVLMFIKPKDPLGFVGSYTIACGIIYFAFFFPKHIYVRDGIISLVKTCSLIKCKVEIADIVSVRSSFTFYNTVSVVTVNGNTYELHPKEPHSLIKHITEN